MNGDIVPPRRPGDLEPAESKNPPLPPAAESPVAPPDMLPQVEPATPAQPGRSKRKLLWWLGGIAGAFILLAVGAVAWYYWSLQPVDSSSKVTTRVSIENGVGYSQLGNLLHDKKLIRSTLAFDVYTRLHHVRSSLQAGAYSLSPSESTSEIVTHLVNGQTDKLTITFFPGATLRDPTNTPESKKTDVTSVLLRAGYSQAEIDAALAKSYDHRGVPSDALFEGKPAGADLEGYIYGETYVFPSDATVEDILGHVFDVYYAKVQAQNIIEPLKQRGLSLYQGITLASIVQREVSASDPSQASSDQRQVAQVFYTRLAQNTPLGSDVTAYYGADKAGVARSVQADTPYNTRKYTGLPPGPIATPSVGALAAVANPAPGDYLFFLSGDDGVTYFAHTDAEHQANIRDHCHVKCSIQ